MDSETYVVNARALGLALGTIRAVVVAVLAPLSRIGWGDGWHELLADVSIGCDDTATGTLVGISRGFLDGLVLGTAFGRPYDRFGRTTA